MAITLESNIGNITIKEKELKLFIVEFLEMIPGIVSVKRSKYNSKILTCLTGNYLKKIDIHQIKENKIGLSCTISIDKNVHLDQITNSIQEIIKYSVQKKYGLKVKYIDIYIKEME